jgi:hypothetical protein
MKFKSSYVCLGILAAVVAWTSAEAYRLWVATQEVAASQQLQMRVAARVEAARAKQVHLAHADGAGRETTPGAVQK